MNEVLASKRCVSPLNGQQFVNLRDYLRQHYEAAMCRATNMTIRIKDVELNRMITDIECYIRQCDEERQVAKRRKKIPAPPSLSHKESRGDKNSR